jgi:diketogulonate reductase-like aldo/keto reductase
MDNIKLNNEVKIPPIGFGTWQLSGKKAQEAVKNAISSGYKLIDTAYIYGNEHEVGSAIEQSDVSRKELFITTKVWTSDLGYETTLTAFDESLDRLGLDYLDLYLIHWPGHDEKLRQESWKALSELLSSGKSKSIGVSNFSQEQIEQLAQANEQKPAVNQIEFHPFIYKRQKPTLDYCVKQGIVVEAYSPLAQAQQMKNEVIAGIAELHKKSVAQVMLRWAIQHGTVPIPRSSNPERIAQNLDVFDFKLSESDMEAMNNLSTGESIL